MSSRGRASSIALVFTAEHGGNDVPRAFATLFRGHDELLASHRGWDPGTLVFARQLAKGFAAPLVATTVTRLLVDCNRSPQNPRVFSAITRPLPIATRRMLVDSFHRPHHAAVEEMLAKALAGSDRVVHVGVHSFTPVFDGAVREVDVALLFDPARPLEKAFAAHWRAALADRRPDLRLRFNHPYRGSSDGLTTIQRRRLPARRYLGIELEINQRFPLTGGREWTTLRRDIQHSLALAVGSRAERCEPPQEPARRRRFDH